MKKRSSLKSSTQTQTEKKKLPLDFELYNSSSRFLYFTPTAEPRRQKLAGWAARKFSLLFKFSNFNFIKRKKHYLLFLLIRNASKQPILAVDFICNFSAQRQVRDLSASTFCWVSLTFRLRIYALMHLDSFTVFQWREKLVNSYVRA